MCAIIEFKNVVMEYKSGNHMLNSMNKVSFTIENVELERHFIRISKALRLMRFQRVVDLEW